MHIKTYNRQGSSTDWDFLAQTSRHTNSRHHSRSVSFTSYWVTLGSNVRRPMTINLMFGFKRLIIRLQEDNYKTKGKEL